MSWLGHVNFYKQISYLLNLTHQGYTPPPQHTFWDYSIAMKINYDEQLPEFLGIKSDIVKLVSQWPLNQCPGLGTD